MATQRILIDWHSHVWLPEHFPPEQLAERSTKSDLSDVNRGRPELHREAMTAVDRYVIVGLQVPWVHIPNDFVAQQVAASNGRAIGFASVDPNHPDAVAELERAIQALGLKGVKLSPVYQAFDPRMDRAMRIYELADHFGVPVMFHIGAAYPSSAALEFGSPVLLDPIARQFPRLRMIIAHLGQPYMAETVMLLRKHPNVYADLSARFHRPWQLYNGLVLAQEYRVWHKLLFGSDFPNKTPSEAIELFRGLNRMVAGTSLPQITEEMVDSILFERPLELLGLAS